MALPLIGVTHAALSNWEYMEVIRIYANQTCSKNLQSSVETIDDIVAKGGQNLIKLKALFGLPNVSHVQDFVMVMQVRKIRAISMLRPALTMSCRIR